MTDFVWPAVRVDGDLDRARVEWIHGNGTGAYSSSTVAQMHTRRYHGLLVAALEPPRRRHVIVSHIDPTLQLDGTTYALATHQFPGVRPTDGHRFLTHFAQDPLPRWTFLVGRGELEHSLTLVRGHNTLVLRYRWNGPSPATLELRPLLAMRSFHSLVREHGAMIQRVELRQYEVSVQPVKALPRLVFRHKGVFIGSPDWWRRFEYLAEQARGMDFQEDLWTPGLFRIPLQPGVPTYLMCSINSPPENADPEALMQQASDALLACDPGPERPWPVRSLSVAADLFRADLTQTPGIVAGYPWFELWGRHSLISLPGLYLVPGRLQEAKKVLQTLIAEMKDGLLPNRLPDEGRASEYHAIDASLWIFPIGRQLAGKLDAKDPFVAEKLLPALKQVFEMLQKGTVDEIHVTSDGLLAAGHSGTSLTWMDARVEGRPVTSRAGLPIEVQALWTRACDDLAALAEQQGEKELAERARAARDKARTTFRARFWCDEINYPYDVLSEIAKGPLATQDASIRPNALIALGLDPELFSKEQAQAILARAERELITPAGVRTLSPLDPQYKGTYAGGLLDRDRSYHQGTAWPFLIGAYSRALRHVYPNDWGRAGRLRALLEGMLSNTLAVGQVPELADGDPPHRPDGCVAHAASVAEMLRVFVEDLGM